MSAFSRQTFALPAIIIIAGLVIYGIRLRKWKLIITGLVIGAIPAFLYFFVLIMNAAMPLFFQQLTGRSEIIETGLISFFEEFWESPMVWFYILVLFALLVFRFTETTNPSNLFRISLLPIGRFVFGFLFIILGFIVFIKPINLFGLAYVHFWLLVLLWIFEEITIKLKAHQRRWFFWSLLIAWTSSLSLGDNAPVFAIGLLSMTGLGYILFQFAERGFSFRSLNQLQMTSGALVVALLVISIPLQKKVNYRDVPSGKQDQVLNAVYPEFGKIRTNSRTFSYLEEIDKLYQVLGFPYGRFVVLPNAAIIYPLLRTPNPMPLDWMQRAEFIGSEDYMEELMKKGIDGQEVFFLIDKIDSKRMADSLVKAVYPEERYPYMNELKELSRELPYESKWFEVRIIK
jgi:hypothetical protein